MRILAALLLLSTPALAQPQQGAFGAWQEAKSLFDAGKYEDAIHSLRSNPVDNAAYYYNLGTVALKMGRAGTAVAFLEKAAALQPEDTATEHNLKLARDNLSHLIGQERLDPASTWYETVADRASGPEARGAVGLVGLILALSWIRSFRRSKTFRETLFQPAGVLGSLGLLMTAGVYGAEQLTYAHPAAICVDRQVVRSGPGDHFLEIGQIEAGTRVRMLGPTATNSSNADAANTMPPSQGASLDGERDRPAGTGVPTSHETWRQVRFSAEGIGWMRSSTLLLL